MNSLITSLEAVFKQAGTREIAEQQAAYMKHTSISLGIPKPRRSTLEKPIFKAHAITDIEELENTIFMLWQKPEREYHYAALELAQNNFTLWDSSNIVLFEQLISSTREASKYL
jgi:3-methyladenine DNA glycosylase AlkD